MTDTKFKTKTKYFFGDIQVCDETFCFLHTISRKQLGCLLNHFDDHGLTTRTHGNSGKFLVGLHIYMYKFVRRFNTAKAMHCSLARNIYQTSVIERGSEAENQI